MTRGRSSNLLHIIAASMADARQQYTDAMARDRADRGLDAATRQAIQDVAGLVEPDTARIVNQEKARLRALAEKADANAERWQQAADILARQADQHKHARDQHQSRLNAAQEQLRQTRIAALGQITALAAADAQGLAAARQTMETAADAARRASLFGRKSALRAADMAQATYRDVLAQSRRHWGSAPNGDDMTAWVATIAAEAVETTPQVTAARADHDQAKAALHVLAREQAHERQSAYGQVYGTAATLRAPSRTAAQHARDWRKQAESARAELANITTIPLTEAAQLIEQNKAGRTQARTSREASRAAIRLVPDQQPQPHRPLPWEHGPSLGL